MRIWTRDRGHLLVAAIVTDVSEGTSKELLQRLSIPRILGQIDCRVGTVKRLSDQRLTNGAALDSLLNGRLYNSISGEDCIVEPPYGRSCLCGIAHARMDETPSLFADVGH